MKFPELSLRNLFWLVLLCVGVLVLVFNWKSFLAALAVAVVLSAVLSIIVAIPTFLISLCLERSFSKAVQRTKKVAAACLGVVLDLCSHIP